MSGSRSNRRDLLKILGGVTAGVGLLDSPFGMLLEAMTRGSYGRAIAQAAGIAPRKWIDLRFDGSPPRWVYDLFLTPYTGGAAYVPNPQVGTKYVATNGRYTEVEYETVTMNGIKVPWLWQFTVPAAGGGDRSMAPLLSNMLQIRGVNIGNPDHSAAQQLHYRPLGAQQTVSALSADPSEAPLAALYFNASSFQFGSMANKSPIMLSGANLISSLLTPFISQSSASFKTNRANLKTYMDAARTAFATELTAKNPAHAISVDAQRSSQELFESTFGDLAVVWADLFNKYQDLVTRAFDPTKVMAGINDLPIGITTTRSLHYRSNDTLVTNEDLRTMVQAATTRANNTMAQSFALAEFVMSKNLSDSLTLGMGSIVGLNVNGATVNHNPDEHFTGRMPSLLLNTYLARAHAACLLEFIDRLKSPAIAAWGETVINVSGEFNRRPRADGTGADHAHEAGSYTLYSGCVSGPKIIGNIKATNGENPYPGTWGFCAPIPTLGGQALDAGYASASIATMLRTPSPLTARSSVPEEDANGKIVPKIELAKIV